MKRVDPFFVDHFELLQTTGPALSGADITFSPHPWYVPYQAGWCPIRYAAYRHCAAACPPARCLALLRWLLRDPPCGIRRDKGERLLSLRRYFAWVDLDPLPGTPTRPEPDPFKRFQALTQGTIRDDRTGELVRGAKCIANRAGDPQALLEITDALFTVSPLPGDRPLLFAISCCDDPARHARMRERLEKARWALRRQMSF